MRPEYMGVYSITLDSNGESASKGNQLLSRFYWPHEQRSTASG